MARPPSSSSPSSSTPPPSSKSKPSQWTGPRICSLACRLYFILIILQIPLFRIQCRAGMCTTPIQITSSQLIANDAVPETAVKVLLYPGAVLNGLFTNMTIPNWNSILQIYNLTDVKNASAVVDLQRLEVLAGSYFTVAGALVGLIAPGRMSMFGTLLVVWGLVKEGIYGKSADNDPTKSVYVYPTMLLALICAVLTVKYNAKKPARSVQQRPTAMPLQSSSKSKLR